MDDLKNEKCLPSGADRGLALNPDDLTISGLLINNDLTTSHVYVKIK